MKTSIKLSLIFSTLLACTSTFATVNITLNDSNDYSHAGIAYAWPSFFLNGSLSSGGSFQIIDAVTLPLYNSAGLTNAINQRLEAYKSIASTFDTFTFDPPGYKKSGMKVSNCTLDLGHSKFSEDLNLEIKVSPVQDVTKDPITCTISKI